MKYISYADAFGTWASETQVPKLRTGFPLETKKEKKNDISWFSP